jgi:hypothetical protein
MVLPAIQQLKPLVREEAALPAFLLQSPRSGGAVAFFEVV